MRAHALLVAAALALTACSATGAPAASSSTASSSTASSTGAAGSTSPSDTSRMPGTTSSATPPDSLSAGGATRSTAAPRRPTDADLRAALSDLVTLDDGPYTVRDAADLTAWRADEEYLVDDLLHADATPARCHLPYYRYRTALTADLARAAAQDEATGVYLTVWEMSTYGEAERAVDAFIAVVGQCPDVTISGGGGSLREQFSPQEVVLDADVDASAAAVSRRTTDGKREDAAFLQVQARIGEFVVQAEVGLTGRVPSADDLAAADQVLEDVVGAVERLRAGARLPAATSPASAPVPVPTDAA